MSNASQRSNKVTLTVEYDAAQWNALTPEDRQRTVEALQQAVNNLPAAKVTKTVTGNEWQQIADKEFIREDGYRVLFRDDIFRWNAYRPDRYLATEGPNSGMVAGHDHSAQKVMDLIDAGWPLQNTDA
jgi:hypothetical protein